MSVLVATRCCYNFRGFSALRFGLLWVWLPIGLVVCGFGGFAFVVCGWGLIFLCVSGCGAGWILGGCLVVCAGAWFYDCLGFTIWIVFVSFAGSFWRFAWVYCVVYVLLVMWMVHVGGFRVCVCGLFCTCV